MDVILDRSSTLLTSRKMKGLTLWALLLCFLKFSFPYIAEKNYTS